MYTLNFKPNFKFSRLKIFWGTPIPVGVCASKAWSMSSACKNMRAQHLLWAEIFPKQCICSGSKLTCNSKPLVDQSSPDFFSKRRRNFPSSYVFPILDILPLSGDIRDQSLKWSRIDRNFACFRPQFFSGEHPEFLKSIYKIQADSDHVAKCQGDRSRDLGESVANKKNVTGKT